MQTGPFRKPVGGKAEIYMATKRDTSYRQGRIMMSYRFAATRCLPWGVVMPLFAWPCIWIAFPVLGAEPVPIILDADMESDVDDVGALALLHVLADLGEARILAVMVSAANPSSAACANRINTYYGRGDLPIGNVKGEPVTRPSRPGEAVLRDSRYARQIAEAFPGALRDGNEAPDATVLYRRILAEQPDRSVVIVTIGYKTNLRNLLASEPDQHSDLGGVDLVRRKVARWVCMGGDFSKRQTEANLVWDAPASTYALDHWPTPIVFSGWEIGAAIHTGSTGNASDISAGIRTGWPVAKLMKAHLVSAWASSFPDRKSVV